MRWDISHCAKTFDQLAIRIFQQRRQSTFPWLTRQSILGDMTRWIQWLLHDSCYDSRVFDTALKDAFGKNRRVFGVSSDDPSGSLYAGSKFGVVTTSISKDTNTFVIGNFNQSHRSCDDYGKGSLLYPLPNKIYLLTLCLQSTTCCDLKTSNMNQKHGKRKP